jgi:hypothetical protein
MNIKMTVYLLLIIFLFWNAKFGYLLKSKIINISMNLEEFVKSLSETQRISLAMRFIKLALPVWNKYAEKNKLTYKDSIVWIKHNVDKNLHQSTIDIIEKHLESSEPILKIKSNEILTKNYQDFIDPITAIQDDDWKLPAAVEKIFFSVYNLLNAIFNTDDNSVNYYYTSINQAIDVIDSEKLLSEEEIKLILSELKNKNCN